MFSAGEEYSNTLHVVLPHGMGLPQAQELLSGFGELMFCKVVPNTLIPSLAVAYYDVRAASQAQFALGFDSCRPGPQTGDRKLKLPGTVKLSQDEIQHISKVETDPEDGGSYIVEFYDVRQVKRAQERLKLAGKKPEGVEPPPGLEGFTSSKKTKPVTDMPKARPAYVLPSASAPKPASASSQAPIAAAESTKDQVEVQIKGLPKALCTDSFLEAMLEQAGLEGAVVCSKALTGSLAGQARVSFSGKRAAKRCVQHFNGRKWGNQLEAVTACIASTVGSARTGVSFPHTPLEMVPENGYDNKVRSISEDTTIASSSGGYEIAPALALCEDGKDATDVSTHDSASVSSDPEALPQMIALEGGK
eukprot:TRINITY_DN67620_c0_g1_i1.p1 TRINITY_DN67620_c0_g1~~TRINITY_DN67620_c0_g1_i1.p1  ORF type:complete len:362 (-),score=90.07 TRINITY_DN67620_c0_g1_i1:181-1266(-)